MKTILFATCATVAMSIWTTPTMAQQSAAFAAGSADRSAYEAWFSSLSGDYRDGAEYWAAHRSIPKEAVCRGDGQRLQGCLASQQRFAPIDGRRRSEPDYRQGWNSVQTAPASNLVGSAGATERLYHVQHDTYGCVKARAALAITNQQDPRRLDQGWINYVIKDGECAPITPKSPWRMVRSEGDLALMSYAGTTGLPGTFYLRSSDLAEAPSQIDPTPLGLASPPTPLPAASVIPDNTAPTPPISSSAPPTTGYYNPPASDASPAVPQPSPPPQWTRAPAAENSNQSSSGGSFWIAVIILVIVATIGAFAMKHRAEQERLRAAERRRMRALQVAVAEIDAKAHLLYVRREQLTQPDYYGTVDPKPWEKERVRFIEGRVMPLLNEGGFADLVAEILPLIFAAVEEAAWRPIDPAVRATFSNPDTYSPDMDPVHYEMHCALQLQKAGWATRSTPRTGDQGADVLAERNGVTLVVQCKLYSNNVGNGAVQEAVAARVYHRTALAAVVSNAAFTRSAKELAGMSGVTLLHHSQLPAFIGRGGPTEVLNEAS